MLELVILGVLGFVAWKATRGDAAPRVVPNVVVGPSLPALPASTPSATAAREKLDAEFKEAIWRVAQLTERDAKGTDDEIFKPSDVPKIIDNWNKGDPSTIAEGAAESRVYAIVPSRFKGDTRAAYEHISNLMQEKVETLTGQGYILDDVFAVIDNADPNVWYSEDQSYWDVVFGLIREIDYAKMNPVFGVTVSSMNEGSASIYERKHLSSEASESEVLTAPVYKVQLKRWDNGVVESAPQLVDVIITAYVKNVDDPVPAKLYIGQIFRPPTNVGGPEFYTPSRRIYVFGPPSMRAEEEGAKA